MMATMTAFKVMSPIAEAPRLLQVRHRIGMPPSQALLLHRKVLPMQASRLTSRPSPPAACRCRASAAASGSSRGCSQEHLPQRQQRGASRALRIVLGAFAACWHALVAAARGAAAQAGGPDRVSAGIKQSVRHFHMLGVIAPFAAASSSANTFLLLTKAMAKFIKIYLLLLFLRVLLSWFPAFNWERQPWLALRQMTDPYLNLYRGLIPPLLGTIDFTPLLGFFILQYLSGVLESGASEDELDEWW